MAALVLALAADLPAPRHAVAQVQDGGVDFPTRRRSFTLGELQRLPDYCQYQQGMPSVATPQGDYYRATLREALDHIHHYCRGLRDMFFARFAPVTAQARNGLWARALQEIDYMVTNTPQDNILMPEFWYQRGEILLQLGRVAEAQEALDRSRALKPDYWPAYTAWADYLAKAGRPADARAVLERALALMPEEPQLRQRLDRIGASPR
jgi:predicted Zn-dependent protease